MYALLQVRTAVLSMLHKLPIDLQQEGRKAQLKKSQLGRYIAFYSKLQDETLSNRKLARGLVEKWSRIIFDQYKEGAEEEAKQVALLFTASSRTVIAYACHSFLGAEIRFHLWSEPPSHFNFTHSWQTHLFFLQHPFSRKSQSFALQRASINPKGQILSSAIL